MAEGESDGSLRSATGKRQRRRPRSPENSVEEFVPRREPERASARGAADSSGPVDQTTGPLRGRDAVPPAVRDRFLVVGRDYFFPDGALAFQDRGDKLTTRSENTEVIRALVEIATVRWSAVTVTGSDRFRKAAWEAGMRAGIAVRGYVATEVERARWEGREQKATEDPRSRSVPGSPTTSAPQPAPAAAREGRPPLVIAGQLLAHGAERYAFRPTERMSYYVKLRTDEGQERTIWGTDLARAMAEVAPDNGDVIALRPLGRERVTIHTPQFEADGQRGPDRERQAHRNRWQIERVARSDRRQAAADVLRDEKTKPSEGAERFPELADAYLHLKAAERLADVRIADPAQRGQFVALVREALAQRHGIGESAPAARLRSGEARAAFPRSIEPLERTVQIFPGLML